MNRILMSILIAAAVLPAWSKAQTNPRTLPRFSGGAPSAEALVDALLQALAANDEQALHRLRVTEPEYCTIIAPGTVEEGHAPRQLSELATQTFWRLLETKSRDIGAVLLRGFGSHRYTLKQIRYTKGTHKYAVYTAKGEVRLDLEDERGEPHEIKAGWIAEVGGRYKFIGFNTNQ